MNASINYMNQYMGITKVMIVSPSYQLFNYQIPMGIRRLQYQKTNFLNFPFKSLATHNEETSLRD